MGLMYFKRFRMELDLAEPSFQVPPLPPQYRLVAWSESLVDAHAEAKFQSFSSEMDANVFPCLGDREGCRKLMREISSRDGFVREATWLLEFHDPQRRVTEYCGTVQGMRDGSGYGAIQNLGVSPRHRNLGLGTMLMHAALAGFRRAGLRRVFLEVTAQNLGAVQLYARLGFQRTRTLYKAADVAYA
jgi:ribosomal protein S18 acetylase RimI-like enzyme